MISLNKIYVLLVIIILFMFSFYNKTTAGYDKLIYDFKIESITGEKIDFATYKNKVILLVNVASQCGFTKQYKDLQNLWEKYKDEGLVVIGFPSNQFGGQEPATNKEIKKFCEVNFNINFPMTTKIDVKGDKIEPIYKWALDNYGKKAIPKWNFYKILINKNGKIEQTYSSMTNPMSNKFTSKIEEILN